MALVLTKGETLNLNKTDNSLTKLHIGCGWDIAETGSDFDLDLTAILLNKDGKLMSDSHVCYFGQKSILGGAIASSGDNRTGAGEGDDEVITADLTQIPAEIEKVLIVVDIYESRSRNQNFGAVSNEFVRLVNAETGAEIAKFEPSDEGGRNQDTSIKFGELYRDEGGWAFKAIGETSADNLGSLIEKYKS